MGSGPPILRVVARCTVLGKNLPLYKKKWKWIFLVLTELRG